MASYPRSRSNTTQWGGGGNSQFNNAINQFLQLMMQKNLWSDRMGGYRELEDIRGQRGMDLENLRSDNRMGEIEQMFINAISQEPKIDALSQRLNQKVIMGEESGPEFERLSEELTRSVVDTSRGVVNQLSPTMPNMPANIDSMLMGLGTSVTERVIAQGQANKRQETDITRVQEPNIALREVEAGQRGYQLQQKDIELMLKKDEAGQEARKRWVDHVGWLKDYLEKQGVKPEGDQAYIQEIFKAISGATGKLVDPLSATDRGEAIKYLLQVEQRLLGGGMPDQTDLNFMQNVVRSPIISEPGNFPTRESGGLPQSEHQTRLREQMIESYYQQLLQAAQARGDDIAQMGGEAALRRAAEQQADLILSQMK